jgi:hypothetical protein
MLRKVLLVISVLAVIGICISGCKKSSDDSSVEVPTTNEVTPTAVQYEEAAKKSITEENLEAELAKLENEVDRDIASDPEP